MERDEASGVEKETPLGPAVPVQGDDVDALREACEGDRADMPPRQTADCAGLDLVESYEQEEDGGS